MKKILTPLFFIQAISSMFAQSAYLKGRISDTKTKETIVGANIVVDDTTGTVADINGNYFLTTTTGRHKVEFKYVGYKSQKQTIDLKDRDTLTLNLEIEQDSKQLDVVVVSAGRFEQKLGDVTVSMEVLKSSLIANKNTNTIESIMEQVPGVNVIDGQANIRGGSGFSYGAGSRVLLVVDEMPMLTADAGDVKWSFLPVENCEQIEVIKGASSALFGSSAMNGVINFRTAYPKDEPETKIIFNGGYYDNPKRHELKWWRDGNQTFAGLNVTHLQKVKNLDIVVGANIYNDEGYRELETEQRYRANFNLRYRFQKIKGLSIGVNANTIRTQGGLFLLWENADSGAYRPAGGDLSHYTTYRTNIDPFINYYTKKGERHSIRGRFFRTTNRNNTDQESTADVYYGEYQYQRRFKEYLTVTSGLVYNYNLVNSGSLYGDHYSENKSAYLQLDGKLFKKLSLSGGVRVESFTADGDSIIVNPGNDTVEVNFIENSKPIPVVRFGMNYNLFKATFIRASYGQGYRFPTVAERFIKTSASGLDIYPNQHLRPESGWSAEIGIKQGLRLGEWKGFIDAAYFWTEYTDMMEFTFGQYGKPVPPYATPHDFGLGFQSQNVGNTRISGVELSLMGQGKMGPIDVSALMGYTYIIPIQTDFVEAVDTAKNSTPKNILKYRYQHTAKADVELGYKKLSLGVSVRANSYMENIDRFFVDALPGIKDYRARTKGYTWFTNKPMKGDVVYDARVAYQMNKTVKVAVIVNNFLNAEYVSRPADVQAPRSFAFQVSIKL